MAGKLTVQGVKNAKAKPLQYEESDGQDGLVLVIFPSAKKSWAVRYRNAVGKQRKVTLGPCERITLADARKQAKALMVRIDAGDDPAAKPTEASEPSVVTVRAVAERFYKEHRKKNGEPPRASTMGEYKRQFDADILPVIGERSVTDITANDLMGIIDRADKRDKPYMANRIHATLSTFFTFCCNRRRNILSDNPIAGITKPNAEKSRTRALKWTEVAELWEAAGNASQPFGAIVRLSLLTAQRRGEVTRMRDTDIDRDAMIWTIPDSIAKNGQQHSVPLTAAMLDEIDGVQRIGRKGLIFTTDGSTVFRSHSKAKRRLAALIGAVDDWRLHDLRRTVATGMAELGVAQEVTEAILNHKSGKVSGVAAVYNRHDYADEKRHALVAWNRFLVDVIANDKARSTYQKLSDKRPLYDAIHSDNVTWNAYRKALTREPVAA